MSGDPIPVCAGCGFDAVACEEPDGQLVPDGSGALWCHACIRGLGIDDVAPIDGAVSMRAASAPTPRIEASAAW